MAVSASKQALALRCCLASLPIHAHATPACLQGQLTIAEMLTEHGAQLDCTDAFGWSALMLACDRGGDRGDRGMQMPALLLSAGANPGLQNAAG